MKLGIFAKTFAGNTPHEVLRAAAGAGYASVQYNMACSGLSALPEAIAPEAADAVLEASRQTAVEIAAVSATYNMIHPVASVREAGRRSFEAIAASAHRMGTRLLTVCTGSADTQDQWRYHPSNDTPAAWLEMCREFERLIPIADRYGIRIGVEPELANVISSAQRARKLMDEMNSSCIRIVLDPANLFEQETLERQKTIIEEAVDLLADRLEMAHAKDRNPDGSFATAGKGVIDFRHFIATLQGAGFDGSVVTHGLAADEAVGVAQFLKRILSEAA